MPVLGLQKGEIFTADVSALKWRARTPAPQQCFLGCDYYRAVSNQNIVTGCQYQFNENIVIAAYGTQMTLHRHPTKVSQSKTKRKTEKEKGGRLSLSRNLDKKTSVRRLSLTLSSAMDSCDSDPDNISPVACYENYSSYIQSEPSPSFRQNWLTKEANSTI